jgi:NAD(P)H-dependent FMN reductase
MLKKIAAFFTFFVHMESSNAHIQNNFQAPTSSLLVISCSLNPESRGAIIAKYVFNFIKSQGYKIEILDLRNYNLPMANGHDQSAYQDSQVKEIHDKIIHAKGIILISPIYNYGVGATGKNLVELTGHPYKNILSGKAWENKILGFIGVSGSPTSMMAPFAFLNGMMLDFKTLIIPSLVIASAADFNEKNQFSKEIQARFKDLAKDLIRFTKNLPSSEK